MLCKQNWPDCKIVHLYTLGALTWVKKNFFLSDWNVKMKKVLSLSDRYIKTSSYFIQDIQPQCI